MKAFCIIFMLFLAGPGYTQLTRQGTINEPVRYVGNGLVDANWNETNTSYPFYTRSDDKGFIYACDALLADKLITLQWCDQDRGLDGFYPFKETGIPRVLTNLLRFPSII